MVNTSESDAQAHYVLKAGQAGISTRSRFTLIRAPWKGRR